VLGVVPLSVAMATVADYALAQLRVPAAKVMHGLLVAGLTIRFESLITPLYYDLQGLGVLGSQLVVILPLIGLFMPFGVLLDASPFRQHRDGPHRSRASLMARRTGRSSAGLLCAASLLIIAPSLLVFLVFQRSFVRALLQGAIR
jgi:ABC-type glycerol-3-phosphate transport system permease component